MKPKTGHCLQRGVPWYTISVTDMKTIWKTAFSPQIKDSYTDYAVTRAIKVSKNNRVIWVVTLEDRKQLPLVRLEDGELEEVERINKK